ncbi:MAG TPA: helix-turn-helix domain-containing protein [Bdellovibrio sp.]
MTTNASQLLQLAQLHARIGEFRNARQYAEACLKNSAADDELKLHAYRIILQSCQELDELTEARPAMDNVSALLNSQISEKISAHGETLIASWFLANRRFDESMDYANSAIAKSTQTRDLPILCRALTILITNFLLDPALYGQALIQLNKLDALLTETDQTETKLSALLFRSFIYTKKFQYENALELLWLAYEEAKQKGYSLFVSSIFTQMATIYKEQKQPDLYRTFSILALKGVNEKQCPRLFKIMSHNYPQDLLTIDTSYDFRINTALRQISEKTKGVIDFKNQHILYELACLFLEHPGQRYSKENLVERIWGQAYDPETHDNLIYVSIKRLRTLLEPDLESPKYILRDRKGYYFNTQAVVHRITSSEELSL